MAKKPESYEKIVNIPLKRAWSKVPRGERGKAASREIKSFLERHLDAEKIKISQKLNDSVWKRGIHRPPASLKVKVNFEKEVITALLPDEVIIKPEEKKKSLRDKLTKPAATVTEKGLKTEIKSDVKSEGSEKAAKKGGKHDKDGSGIDSHSEADKDKADTKGEQLAGSEAKNTGTKKKEDHSKPGQESPSREEVKNVLDKLKEHKEKTEEKK